MVNSLIFVKKDCRDSPKFEETTIENNNAPSNRISVVVNSILELTFLQLFFRGKRRDGAFTSIQQETSFQYSSSTCCRPLSKHWQKQWRKFNLQIRMDIVVALVVKSRVRGSKLNIILPQRALKEPSKKISTLYWFDNTDPTKYWAYF